MPEVTLQNDLTATQSFFPLAPFCRRANVGVGLWDCSAE